MKYNLLCLLFFVYFLNAVVVAQPTVIKGLTIKNNQQWSGTVIVEGDVEIAAGARLVLAPATTVVFKAKEDKRKSGFDKTLCELIVHGVLIARGQKNQLIRFTSSSEEPLPGDWYGISIKNKQRPSIIEYAVLEYAYNGITIRKNKTQLSHLIIQKNYNSGINCEFRSLAELKNSIISENGFAGIICANSAEPVITHNIISHNKNGIVNYRTAKPNLGSLDKGRQYNPGKNVFIENLDFDICHHATANIRAENNYWNAAASSAIGEKIFDFKENKNYGKVDFLPRLRSVNIKNREIYEIRISSQDVPENNQPPIRDRDAAKKQQNGDSGVTGTQNSTIPVNTNNGKSNREPSKHNQLDEDQVFLDIFLDQEREIIKKITPTISQQEQRKNIHGQLIVGVVVDKQGKVISARILKGINAYYDSLALKVAKQFLFNPGKINDRPVKFTTSLIFDF